MTNDTEYMYASARIRAAEGKDTASARLHRMLDCRTPEQLLRTVIECGFFRDDHPLPETLEQAWDMALTDAAALVCEVAPDPAVYDFLFYKYDCNNIKTALKAGIIGQNYDSNFYHCGTFAPTGLTERLAAGDHTGLPTHMGEAVDEAMTAYARTGEGRQIDFIIDKACYKDMAAAAGHTGVSLFRDYVAAKADFTNVLSSVRLSSGSTAGGNPDTARAIFDMVFVPGGDLAKEQFTSQSEGCLSYMGLLEQLDGGMVKEAVRTVAEGGEVRPEKVFDEAALSILDRERYTPFGVHVPAVFFLQREAELKNGRIIGAGLLAGLTGQETRERVRVAYV